MTTSRTETRKQARMTNFRQVEAHRSTASFDKTANITAEHREGA